MFNRRASGFISAISDKIPGSAYLLKMNLLSLPGYEKYQPRQNSAPKLGRSCGVAG
jgi:hypothetical protein